MSPRPGMSPEQALRMHQEALLEAVSVRDLPKKEVYEFADDGTTVMKHDMRYANFFKQVCLEQVDLLEELAQDEENYIMVRRNLKQTKKRYLARVDEFCSLLKKRIDRPDTESDEDYHGS